MTTSVIGFKIRKHRKQLGLTQAQLATQAGISASYLNLIESNKRAVGGSLLSRIAQLLSLQVEVLSGELERRLSDDLRELSSQKLFNHLHLEVNVADELVARNPDWVRAMLVLYRAYLESDQTVAALTDRLNKDPILQRSVHQMLTYITSIRSTSEILNDVEDLDTAQRQRFYATLHSQSVSLTAVASELVALFGSSEETGRSAYADEEVDEFIIGQRTYFPDLEAVAQELRTSLDRTNSRDFNVALAEFLQTRFGITVSIDNDLPLAAIKNQTVYDATNQRLRFLSNSTASTRRFQMAKLIADLSFDSTLKKTIEAAHFSSNAARYKARYALTNYIAGAALLPYSVFLEQAQDWRYDIERLRQHFQVSFEQVCHRLVTLRDPKAECLPFGFLRIDASGHMTKRFPLHGFTFPRYGHGCPLWGIYAAIHSSTKVHRRLVELPGGGRFLQIARGVIKQATGFNEEPVRFAVMLVCDSLHADKTVYGDGLDLSNSVAILAGPGCRQCDRIRCPQRQESVATTLHL